MRSSGGDKLEKKRKRGRPFEKGNTAWKKSKQGRKSLTDEQRELNKLIKSEKGKFLIARYWFELEDEISRVINDPDSYMGEKYIAQLIQTGFRNSDLQIAQWVFARLGWDRDDDGGSKTITITIDKDDEKL